MMARRTRGIENNLKHATVPLQGSKRREEPLLEGISKRRKEQIAYFVELSVRFRENFGEENFSKVGLLFATESIFDNEKLKSGKIDDGWVSKIEHRDIQSLIVCLEYFLELEQNQTEFLLHKLSLPVNWPTALLTDDVRERKKMLAIIIRNDMISEFIEQIEQRFLEPQVVAAEKREREIKALEIEEERRERDEKNKAALGETITNNTTLRHFISILPEIPHNKIDQISASWIPKEISKEAMHLAWSGGLGTELIELCKMSRELEKIRSMNPRYILPRTLSFLPKKYWHTNNACGYHKVIRDFYRDKLTKDECIDMLGFFDVSVMDCSNDKICLKHTQTDMLMTILRDGVQKTVESLEKQKMILRLKMGLIIKSVTQSLELQIEEL